MDANMNASAHLVVVAVGGERVARLAGDLASAARGLDGLDVRVIDSRAACATALARADEGITAIVWVGDVVRDECGRPRLVVVDDDGGGDTWELTDLVADGSRLPGIAVARLSPQWGELEVIESHGWPGALAWQLRGLASRSTPGGIGVEMPPINGLISAANPQIVDRSFGIWQIQDTGGTKIGHMLRSTGAGSLNGIHKGYDIWSFDGGLWSSPFVLVPYPAAGVQLSSGDIMDPQQHAWLQVKEQGFYRSSPGPTSVTLSAGDAIFAFEIYTGSPAGAVSGWMVARTNRTLWYIPSTTGVKSGRLDVTTSHSLAYGVVWDTPGTYAIPFTVDRFCTNGP